MIRGRPTARVVLATALLVLLLLSVDGWQKGNLSFSAAVDAYASELEPALVPPAAPEAQVARHDLVPAGPVLSGLVTHYGVSYNGEPLGCGRGYYSSEDLGIIAVGIDHYEDWPCGTILLVCGPAGCLIGWRQDACPGCLGNHLDLTEAGLNFVCGALTGVCGVAIQALNLVPAVAPEPLALTPQPPVLR